MNRLVSVRRFLTRALLLCASALAVPGSTAAVPTDLPDLDAPAPTGANPAPGRSLWDAPAPAPSGAAPLAPAQPTKAAEGAVSANPLWAIPLASLSSTRERPIFSASRRPPPPAVVAAPVAKAPPPKPPRVERPSLSLVGTIAGEDASFAIFVDQTTKAALRLKIGDDYQGWKLSAVHGREVTLVHDEQSAILSLPQPGGGGTAGPVARVQAESTVAQGTVAPPVLRNNRR